MPHPLSCPSCASPLERRGPSFACAKNHTFDLSADGYLNLLLANQKHSADPGDAKEMVRARREFLQKGFYRTLADRIDTLCADAVTSVRTPVILDIGCGEGYYTESVKIALPKADVYGLDISKAAAKIAARSSDAVSYIVASMKHLPFAQQTVDIVLSVFAPVDFSECQRILRPKGRMIVVRPGTNHLHQFKAALGLKELSHDAPTFDLQKTSLKTIATHHVRGSIRLTENADILNLCRMTPLYWRSSPEAQKALASLGALQTDVDFHIAVLGI